MKRRPPRSTLFPTTTLFRSERADVALVVDPLQADRRRQDDARQHADRSEEHTSELQSRQYLVCRLLLEKKQIHEGRIAALYRVQRRPLVRAQPARVLLSRHS